MKRIIRLIPIYGVITFVGLYLYSSNIYPGGTRFDNTSTGYSHLYNFWCDLLDQQAFNGQTNPSRIFAELSIVILSFSLIPFCYNFINLFGKISLPLNIARWASILAMIFSSLILIWHDTAINLFVGFNIVASVIYFYSLTKNRMFNIILSTIIPFILCVINFLMWKFDNQNNIMPFVQKLAISSSLIWICFINFKLFPLTKRKL